MGRLSQQTIRALEEHVGPCVTVEINGETVTVTVTLDGTEVASCEVTVGGATAECVLDLGTGSLSQRIVR